jgi:hypothetical protein
MYFSSVKNLASPSIKDFLPSLDSPSLEMLESAFKVDSTRNTINKLTLKSIPILYVSTFNSKYLNKLKKLFFLKFSPEKLSYARWDVTPMNIDMKNPIEIDYSEFYFVWKSDCKNTRVKLHFNKRIFTARYPVRLPVSENDEYERNCDNYNQFKLKTKTVN